MGPRLIPGAVGSSVSLRASLALDMATSIAKQEEEDAVTSSLLLDAAPKELNEWLTGHGAIQVLFKYGKYETSVRFWEEDFQDLQDVRAKMAALGEAWKDVVSIRLGDPEPHKVTVYLTAVM